MEKCKKCGILEKVYFLYYGLCDKCSMELREQKFQESLANGESLENMFINSVK